MQPELAKPGEVYRITVDAGVTSNVFLKGHRIRLEISSSNFPRFDRNPNTGRQHDGRDPTAESEPDRIPRSRATRRTCC